MHPDLSLVLQKSASNLNLKHKPTIVCKHFNYNHKIIDIMSKPTTAINYGQDDSQDLVRIVSDEEEEEDQEGTAYNDKVATQSMVNEEEEEEEDNISLGSELSVGRENPETSMHNDLEDDEVLDISDTHSNSSCAEEMQHSPALNSPAETTINPFTLANTLRFPVPFGLPNNSPVAAANISPFQEEFLRKSHLYAEELMKHQMQLMAAARASAFTLRTQHLPQLQTQISAPGNLLHLNPLTKIDQLKAAAAVALTAAAQQNKPLNPRGHQHILPNHQNPYAYNMASDTLAKLTDLSKQHISKPTIPMSTLNQLQTQMQAHLPGLLQDNNDNLHERALKFSIDNILKADFGRSNSLDSPPQLRKGRNKQTTTPCPTDSLDNSLLHSSSSTHTFSSSLATICTNSNDSCSTAVSSSYGSANGTHPAGIDLLKSSPSQTPSLSPGCLANNENNNSSSKLLTSKSEESLTATATTASTKTAASSSSTGTGASGSGPIVWPAWVYCTRYSDRPSSGPRVRKPKTPKNNSNAITTGSAGTTGCSGEKANSPSSSSSANTNEDKRPRTAFSGSQLARLKNEFNENRYLTEKRRQQLSSELGLNEAQIKIWFQNKRAKLKKSSGVKNPLALQLMAQGLYNHSTIPLTREEEELQELQEREKNNNNNNNLQQQPAASTVSS